MREPVDLLAALIDEAAELVRDARRLVDRGAAYERFTIPKPGRRPPREITAPVEVLKRVQRGIITILEPLPLSMAVHGFRRARSIVTGARAHAHARALINVDLEEFFHSVDDLRVVRALERSLVPRLSEETKDLSTREAREVASLIAHLCTYRIGDRPRPVLPQGAPTSPFLANLAARKLDDEIRQLLDQTPGELTYTRYADDLTISAPHEIDRTLLGEILRTIQRAGFRHNPEKVHIASTIKGSPNYRQKLFVTSLAIDTAEHKVRIPRARLERFRMLIHQASVVPKLEEAERRRIEGIVSFVHMVYGELPPSLNRAYERFCAVHRAPRLSPGKSRRRARARAMNPELYR
jgi:hypothetical protein